MQELPLAKNLRVTANHSLSGIILSIYPSLVIMPSLSANVTSGYVYRCLLSLSLNIYAALVLFLDLELGLVLCIISLTLEISLFYFILS
jgi:hypothetical protein